MYENVAGNLVLREIFWVAFTGITWLQKRLRMMWPLLSSCLNPLLWMLSTTPVVNFLRARWMWILFRWRDSASLMTSSLRWSDLCRPALLVRFRTSYCFWTGNWRSSTQMQLATWWLQNFLNLFILYSDLNGVFVDLPLIGKALSRAQNMLFNVERGEVVDALHLFDNLRWREYELLWTMLLGALLANSVAWLVRGFLSFPMSEKSHVLLAQAIRSWTKDFKSIVAVVEASS